MYSFTKKLLRVQDFFKYLTPSESDINWGFYLNVAGKASIEPRVDYPPCNHPSGYYFTWENGRILDEYQINYITNGSGIYENESGKFAVKPGTLLITRPGEWHRYKPVLKTGWIEHYIGFNGFIAKQVLDNNSLSVLKPVIIVGNRGEFIDTYLKIFEYVKEEKPGYQQVSSGMVMKLLGYLVSFEKQKNFTEAPVEKIIQKACFLIRENIEGEFDLQRFSEESGLGYSYFRKIFKKYTGLPPVQYQIDLKIMRSRELLLSTNKSVKEISYELGFQSAYYFSRAFKKKMGIAPTVLRTQQFQ